MKCVNLRKFTLARVHEKELHSIIMYAEHLEVINVSKSQEVTGMSLQSLKNIRELHIDNCPQITEETIVSFCFYYWQILEVFSVDVRSPYILGIICETFNNISVLNIWTFRKLCKREISLILAYKDKNTLGTKDHLQKLCTKVDSVSISIKVDIGILSHRK
jgi:hypothetical protein